MHIFIIPAVLAILVQQACQLFKFIAYSIRDKRVSPKYLVSSGGIPSAHSAFVSSLTVSLGWQQGFESPVFSTALVFSLIVMYDAFRLRGHVQNHAAYLSRLSKKLGLEDEPELSEMVGHSLGEVAWGIVIGGGLTALCMVIFRQLA